MISTSLGGELSSTEEGSPIIGNSRDNRSRLWPLSGFEAITFFLGKMTIMSTGISYQLRLQSAPLKFVDQSPQVLIPTYDQVIFESSPKVSFLVMWLRSIIFKKVAA